MCVRLLCSLELSKKRYWKSIRFFIQDIFDYFLKHENKSPDKLAYDRPSEKLIGFLRKHFGLNKFIPQNNNYVVFNDYFDNSYR
jgi:hypothetical protein